MDQILKFNPAVINTSSTGAHIANINALVVAIQNADPTPYYGFQTTGNLEQVGTYTAITQALDDDDEPVTLQLQFQRDLNPNPQVAVRISFDVIPNNGAPKSSIIKTFWANSNIQDAY